MPSLPDLLAPVTQSAAYHAFADQRALLGIANFWNVVSNLAFVAAGIYGARRWRGASLPYRVVNAAAFLIAAGSAYYHLAPSNGTLYWDRLPMTLAFMSVLAAAFSERMLIPLLIAGAASVEVWRQTGDLRFYGAVQFVPMLALLAIPKWWPMIGLYAVAKLLEHFDGALFAAIGLSGHTLKHLAAAAALALALRTLQSAHVRNPHSGA